MANHKKFADPKKAQEVLRDYQNGYNIRRLSKMHNCSEKTMKDFLNSNNIETKHFKRFSTKEMREITNSIIKLYDAGIPIKHICKKLHHNSRIIYKVLRENNKLIPKIKLTEEDILVIKRMHSEKVSIKKIAKIFKCSDYAISNIVGKQQIKYGKDHASYKEGRKITDEGYVQILLSPDDPLISMCHSDNYILEHRYVMASYLNRPLYINETVHHIDGNKQNNVLRNLQLRIGKHGKGVALCCMDCGSREIKPTDL